MKESILNGSCFVVVEGSSEGVGKSTIVEHLRARLEHAGHSVVVVRQPGGTPFAEGARELFKSTAVEEDISPVAEYMLLASAREQLDYSVIEPALRRGCVVITDRHTLSTHAYQGIKMPFVDSLVSRTADVTVFAHAPLAVSMARTVLRNHDCRIERKSIEYFSKVFDNAMREIELPTHGKVCKIDTTDFEAVSFEREVIKAVDAIIAVVENRVTVKELEKAIFEIERIHVICMGDSESMVHGYRMPALHDGSRVIDLKDRVAELAPGLRVVVHSSSRHICDDTLLRDIRLP